MTRSSERSPLTSVVILGYVTVFFLASVSAAQSPDLHTFGLSADHTPAPVHFSSSSSDPQYPELMASHDFKRPAVVRSTETHPKAHAPISASDLSGDEGPEEPRAIRIPSGRFMPAEQFDLEKRRSAFEPLPAKSRFLIESDDDAEDLRDSQNGVSEKFHWKPAILQSILIQGVQHGYALAVQEKTRRELKGPWFKDWFNSVRGLHGWDDGNKFFTNYIAHPWQGAMTGFIFLQNHDRLKKQKFSESKTYWVDRLKAMAWSAAWSTQWEIGPFSQAAIGNVGLKKGMAYVDLVMTPTAGTGWMVLEEALDRYVIRHVEERSNFFVKIFLRTLLNPMRGVANALRFKPPWYRDRPFGT